MNTIDNSTNIRIKTIKTIEDIENIRSFWEENQWELNADIDFYLTVVKARDEVICPYILVVYDNDSPVFALIGRKEKAVVPLVKLGYMKFIPRRIRIINFIFGGSIGKYKNNYIQLVRESIKSSFKSEKIDIIRFNHINVDSELYNSLKNNIVMQPHIISNNNIHWFGVLPQSYEEFVANIKKSEKEWVRMPRKLEKDFHGRYEYVVYTETTTIDKVCKDAELISKGTYKRGLGVGFEDNDEKRQILFNLAERNILKAYFLYIDTIPYAFKIGVQYNLRMILFGSGHKPDLYKYKPGNILFFNMAEDLINNTIIKEIDFGFGDAHYKKRFGTHYIYESSITIFPISIKGIYLYLIQKITISINDIANTVLIKWGYKAKLKKLWRKKLSKNQE